MKLNKIRILPHKHSLKKQLMFFLTAVLALLIGLLVFSNMYAAVDSNNKIAASNRRTIDYSVRQIESCLSNVDESMIGLVASSEEYKVLYGGTQPLQAHLASQQLIQQFREYLRIYNYCNAFFVYSEPSNSYRDIFSDEFTYSQKIKIASWMRNAVGQDMISYSDGWVTREISGEKFLMRFYGGRGCYLIALSTFSTLENVGVNIDEQDGQAEVIFCTRDGAEISGQHPDIDFTKVLGQEDYIVTGSPRRMILHKDIQKTDVTLCLLVAGSEFFNGLSNMQVFLMCLSFLSVLFIPFALLWVRRSVIQPLNALEKTIVDIRAGNLDAEAAPSEIIEFQDVSVTFNDMMKQIKKLKIEAYEREIETQKAQLQYLQLQIRPHFYLNCLKGLYAVAQKQDVEKLQKIILSISSHLRYIFRDQLELVPLHQEVEHIRNYIDIQQLVSAYPPECRIDVPESLENFMIPPLSLSTFVENSIKHRAENQPVIHVKASLLDGGEERFIDLVVQDNGPGYSEQVLRELSNDDQTVYSTDHVGIRNIRQRFRLIYGKKVMFAFYNTPCGPVSEIVIPLSGKKKGKFSDDDFNS